MGHGAGHGRKKKKSIVRKLAQASVTRLIPNTYSRRMTRYSAYDADAVTVRVRSQMIDIFQYFYVRLSRVFMLKIWLYRERNINVVAQFKILQHAMWNCGNTSCKQQIL